MLQGKVYRDLQTVLTQHPDRVQEPLTKQGKVERATLSNGIRLTIKEK